MQRLDPILAQPGEEVADMELSDDRFTFPQCKFIAAKVLLGCTYARAMTRCNTLDRWVPEVLKMAGLPDWVGSAHPAFRRDQLRLGPLARGRGTRASSRLQAGAL